MYYISLLIAAARNSVCDLRFVMLLRGFVLARVLWEWWGKKRKKRYYAPPFAECRILLLQLRVVRTEIAYKPSYMWMVQTCRQRTAIRHISSKLTTSITSKHAIVRIIRSHGYKVTFNSLPNQMRKRLILECWTFQNSKNKNIIGSQKESTRQVTETSR